MTAQRPLRALSADTLAAALLTIAILATAAAAVPSDAASRAPVASVAEDGLPGKGLPPSPGPTDPNSPAQ